MLELLYGVLEVPIMINEIMLGKWEDWLPRVEAQSVRLALLDLPYNTTALSWDKQPIDLVKLWEGLEKVLLPDGNIVFTSNQPFTTALINSNPKWFRYCLVWDKGVSGSFTLADYMPLKTHEDICIFGPPNKRNYYHPQKVKRTELARVGGTAKSLTGGRKVNYNPKLLDKTKTYDEAYPKSIQYFSIRADKDRGLHETQKPVKLFQWVILSYSAPGDIVLDLTSGSGTTAIAALNTGRNFICIEQDYEYWQKATKRLELAKMQGRFNWDDLAV